jgi:hypothetical protein
LIKKFTPSVIGLALVAKLLALFAGSYPFDFATFVYQARSFFEYGIHPLFFWNKGIVLLGIFYGQYGIYQILINIFSHSQENALLAHFLYKFMFFAADILTAYFIAKIVWCITQKRDLARYGALLWLVNPFLLWSVEFQGSYAIVAVLFGTMSLYYFLEQRYIRSVIFLALSVSVYYYAVIFLPFYLIMCACESKTRKKEFSRVLAMVTTFIATIVLLYLPFFFNAQFAHQLISSLSNHAAPNASPFAAATQLPTYSLLKFPFYAVAHYFPTNQSDPYLFKIAGLGTVVGVLLVCAVALKTSRYYFRKTIYSLYSRYNTYNHERFIYDLLVVVTLFLLLVGAFQDHYLIWVLPYMVICAVAFGKRYMARNLFILSFLAIIRVLGTNNLGLYFLDLVPSGPISVYLNQTDFSLALNGFIIMLFLASNLLIYWYKKSKPPYTGAEAKSWITLSIAFNIFIGITSLMALTIMLHSHVPTELGSDRNVYNFAYVPKNVAEGSVHDVVKNIDIRDANFGTEKPGLLKPNQLINPRQSPWFLYNYHGSAQDAASIVREGQDNSLMVTPNKRRIAIQLNFGRSKKIIPVNSSRLYSFTVSVKDSALSPNDYKLAVRFVDQYGNVIAGSDKILQPTSQQKNNTWLQYSAIFTPPMDAFFIEPLFTVEVPKDTNMQTAADVQVTNFSIQDVTRYVPLMYNKLVARSNGSTIDKYVLVKPTNKYFDFEVTIPRDNYAENVQQVALNDCVTRNIRFDDQDSAFEPHYSPDCYKKGSTNTLEATTINYIQQPEIQISLLHKPSSVSIVRYHHAIYIFFAIIGIILSVTLSLLIILCSRKF